MELSVHQEVRTLFPALIDAELDRGREQSLRAHLDECLDCRQGWVRYERAITLVRKVEREKAPAHLSSIILRRVRKQRSSAQRRDRMLRVVYRVPYEIMIPIMLAAAVAALLIAS